MMEEVTETRPGLNTLHHTPHEEKLWETKEDAEIIVKDMVDLIIEEGGHTLYESYLEKKSIPHTVHSVMTMISNTVDSFFLNQDFGDQSSGWHESVEATRPTIDTWGRGTINVKRRTRYVKLPTSISEQSKGPRSVASSHWRRVGKKHQQTASKDDDIPLAIELDDENDNDEMEEQLRKQKDKENLRRKEELETRKKREEEEAENERRLAKVAADLKSKEFTYDNAGRIMMVTHVKPEKLPPTNYLVRFDMPSEEDEEKRAKKKEKKRTSLVMEKSASKGVLKKRQSTKSQTLLGDSVFALLQPNSGVRMMEAGRLKQGSMTARVENKMSRKDYNDLTQASRVKYEEARRREKGESMPTTMLSDDKDKHKLSLPTLRKTNLSLESMDRADPLKSVQVKNEDLLKRINEMNVGQTTWIPGTDANTTTSKGMSKTFGAGRVRRAEDLDPNDTVATAIDKFNMEILANSSWGLERTSGSFRPGSKNPKTKKKDVIKALGNVKKLPRERNVMGNLALSHKHLPAPPLGRTMGHGIIHEGVVAEVSEEDLERESLYGTANLDSLRSNSKLQSSYRQA
mmetsp:Transcript_33597/g.38177  ORF Transcript_33597/g.38177 Transcript_33597/m.38177 type:complete len:572 (-) Transcript_33597:316-2031(-)